MMFYENTQKMVGFICVKRYLLLTLFRYEFRL
eukprot:UN07602